MQNTKNSSQVVEFPSLRASFFKMVDETPTMTKIATSTKTSDKEIDRFNALSFLPPRR